MTGFDTAACLPDNEMERAPLVRRPYGTHIRTLNPRALQPLRPSPRRVDYEGNNNVIESAGILGVTRLVLVTSVGCGDSADAAPPAVFEALKDVLQDKEKVREGERWGGGAPCRSGFAL